MGHKVEITAEEAMGSNTARYADQVKSRVFWIWEDAEGKEQSSWAVVWEFGDGENTFDDLDIESCSANMRDCPNWEEQLVQTVNGD